MRVWNIPESTIQGYCYSLFFPLHKKAVTYVPENGGVITAMHTRTYWCADTHIRQQGVLKRTEENVVVYRYFMIRPVLSPRYTAIPLWIMKVDLHTITYFGLVVLAVMTAPAH